MYKNTKPDESKIGSNLFVNLEIFLSKVKNNDKFSKIFKKCVPCGNYFKDLVFSEKYEEALTRICKFVEEIINDSEKLKYSELSPSNSEFMQSINSVKSNTGRYYPDDYNDEDPDIYQKKIDRLNSEIDTIVASSREALSNKSFSMSVRSPKNEEEKPVSERKSGHLRTPDIKIIRRPANKGTKGIARPSILKRNE